MNSHYIIAMSTAGFAALSFIFTRHEIHADAAHESLQDEYRIGGKGSQERIRDLKEYRKQSFFYIMWHEPPHTYSV